MTKEELTAGDEVQHKTGKQKMIYLGESALGDALCEWTDARGTPLRDAFAFAALKRWEATRPAHVGTISRA